MYNKNNAQVYLLLLLAALSMHQAEGAGLGWGLFTLSLQCKAKGDCGFSTERKQAAPQITPIGLQMIQVKSYMDEGSCNEVFSLRYEGTVAILYAKFLALDLSLENDGNQIELGQAGPQWRTRARSEDDGWETVKHWRFFPGYVRYDEGGKYITNEYFIKNDELAISKQNYNISAKTFMKCSKAGCPTPESDISVSEEVTMMGFGEYLELDVAGRTNTIEMAADGNKATLKLDFKITSPPEERAQGNYNIANVTDECKAKLSMVLYESGERPSGVIMNDKIRPIIHRGELSMSKIGDDGLVQGRFSLEGHKLNQIKLFRSTENNVKKEFFESVGTDKPPFTLGVSVCSCDYYSDGTRFGSDIPCKIYAHVAISVTTEAESVET